jgi:protein O-mannosyl-transferase
MESAVNQSNRILFSLAKQLAARPGIPAWLVAVLLILMTVALYWPATHNDFINYDDDVYVTANGHVQGGLTAENIPWAFVNPVSANWHPLTILSHMADCQLYGLKTWGHHLTSILVHAVNTMLVFLLLHRITRATWRSAAVAAVFALHPFHVQSVAWVAERKDVLSTCFGLLALILYVRYVRIRTNQRQLASGSYLCSLVFFAFGLMSKPMLVTLPCVMLLLDYWPLQRYQVAGSGFGFQRLVFEKLPFFVLAAGSSVVTFLVQEHGGAIMAMDDYTLENRVVSALISYCRYLEKSFWPTDLAVFYPHVAQWPMLEAMLAAVLLGGITASCFLVRRGHPFCLMGWLWFVGTLVPVIGLVQAGEQSMADRYTYFPSLGLFIVVVWGAHELAGRSRYRAVAVAAAFLACMVACVLLTRQQLGYWKDSETLFRHALAVTDDNTLAETDLGLAVLGKGRVDEAIGHLQTAARLQPTAAEVHNNLGLAYLNQKQYHEAIEQFQIAINLKPSHAKAHGNLGLAFFGKNDFDGAVREFQATVDLQPDFDGAQVNLGFALLKSGRTGEAIGQLQGAINRNPDDGNARFNLGVAFSSEGRLDEAIVQYQEAIRINPNDADAKNNLARDSELKKETERAATNPAALNNLAWRLATSPIAGLRNGTLAVKLAEQACQLTQYRAAVMVGTLAAAYAEAGRFDEAVATGQKACALASEFGEAGLLQRNRELVALYQAHRAYHEPAQSAPAPQ